MKKTKKAKARAKKPLETKRYTRFALYGLIIGIVLTFSGILIQQPSIIIIGYTLLILCTGIYSFLTVLNWLSTKSYEREQKQKAEQKPRFRSCPRCGAETEKDIEYCRKCGKKLK